ncbi:MAG: C-GCAxxG-C-C family protein [Syntrophorhabdus sp.]
MATFGQELGLDREMALKVACAFGGGMARMGETCGAVTGAMMAIGLKHGKARADDHEAREKTYHYVKEFIIKLIAKHQSIVCRELIDCDMSTHKGLQDFKDRNLAETHCIRFVKDAAGILEEIFLSSK